MEFTGEKITTPDGKGWFIVNHDTFLKGWLTQFPDGTELAITVKADHGSWSSKMFNYYYGCVVETLLTCLRGRGFDIDKDSADRFLKGQLAVDIIRTEKGSIRVPIKKRVMQRKEALVYIASCIRWIQSEFGVTVPTPGDHLGENNIGDFTLTIE